MKRLISFLVSSALAVSVFAAGQGDAAVSKSSANEKMTISVAFFAGSVDFFGKRGEDKVLQKIEDKFNVVFDFKPITWGNFKEKLNLWATAGELPDYFVHALTSLPQYGEWVDQGIVKALPANLDKYPNVKALVTKPQFAAFMRDGKYWMIPRENGGPNNEGGAAQYALFVRKDWREKLGIPQPTSFEEYKTMLKAFVSEDPDGDGRADTQGMVPREPSWGMDTVAFPLAPKNWFYWTKADGRWTPAGYSQAYKDAAVKVASLVEEGLVDRDYVTFRSTQDAVDRFAQGQVGVLASQPIPNAIKIVSDTWSKFNKDSNFFDCVEIMDTFPWAYQGTRYRFSTIGFWAENYFAGTISDEKQDRILQICDYLLGPEGSALWLYGIEGETYDMNNGAFTDLRPKDAEGKTVALDKIYPSQSYFSRMVGWALEAMPWDNPLYEIQFGKDIMGMANGYMTKLLAETKPIDVTFGVGYIMTPMKGKIPSMSLNEILMDADPAAKYDAKVEAAKKAGLYKWIEEVNAEAARLGY